MKISIPIAISLPGSLVREIDSRRGDISRSRYIFRILKNSLKEKKW